MNHLDRNYITPYVPHTFTTRSEGSHIVAVTYQSIYTQSDRKVYANLIDKNSSNKIMNRGENQDLITFCENSRHTYSDCFCTKPRSPITRIHHQDFITQSTKPNRDSWLYIVSGSIKIDMHDAKIPVLYKGDSIIIKDWASVTTTTPDACIIEVSLLAEQVVNEISIESEIDQLRSAHGNAIFERIKTDTQAWF